MTMAGLVTTKDGAFRAPPAVLAIGSHVAVGAVACTPILLGGATSAAATLATIVACAGMLLASIIAPRHTGITSVTWLGFAMTMATIASLCPVPCSALAWLGHPERAELGNRALALLGAGTDLRCRVSVDPGATERAAATAAGCLAALVTGTLMARARGTTFVLGAVGFGGLAVAVVTYVHAILGIRTIFGIHEPEAARYGWPSPLLNGNHLAGLMVLAVPCCLAVARKTDHAAVRLGSVLAATIATSMALASHSRGGVVALGIAVAASAVILVRDRRRSAASATTLRISVAMLVVPAALFAIFIEGQTLIVAFRDEPYKTGLISDALAFAFRQGPFGVGRGAFAAAYATTTGPAARATYPENIVAQWVAEFGPTLGLLALLTFSAVLLRLLFGRRTRTSVRLGAVGIAALAAQNCGDYSLEMPGVAFAASLALGATTAELGGLAPLSRWWAARSASRYLRRAPAVLALVAATLFVPLAYRDDLDHQLSLVTRTRANHVVSVGSTAAWVDLIAMHPLEPSVYLHAAAKARAADSPATLGFVNLARRAAPRWSGPHVEAYLYLIRHGRASQGIAEIARLAESSPEYAARVTCMSPPREFLVDRWARALPRESSARFIRELGRCIAPAARVTLAREASKRHGRDEALAIELVNLTRAVDGDQAALRELEAARARIGQRGAFDALGARIALGRAPLEALATIAAARRASRADGDFDEIEARASAATGDVRGTGAALRRIESRVHTLSDMARLERLRASCEITLGRPDNAVLALQAAYAAEPAPDLLREVARISGETGRSLRADAAMRRLCADFPSVPECANRARTSARP
jgi:hypothetical protein